jgi:GH25 family lysozyme M1 (1,4-beta-N-acetylmuramidase)
VALGIDIYRYQTVTDPAAVARAGVRFAYVKGTDGGGPAQVRAGGQVKQMKHAGIPVGLYHYAQLSPSPERQADVLADEVRALDAAGLPPALDLEDPHRPGAAARDFTVRFLAQLKRRGFGAVTLYANTSMLTGIGAPALSAADPTVVVWAASYGPNDGKRHPLTYRGRVDIHQYTSVGIVAGISGRTDLNYAPNLTWIGGKDTDVQLTDKIRFWDGFEITVGQALADSWQLANNLSNRPTRPNEPADPPPWIAQLFGELAAIRAEQARQAGIQAAQAEVLRQVAQDEELDIAAIRQAALEGAKQGVAESTIDVDINVAGPITGVQEGDET